MRRARQDTQADGPSFRDDSSLRSAARTYRLLSMDRGRLTTVTGRVIGHRGRGDVQRRTWSDHTWTIGGAELVRRSNVWYLHITQTNADPVLSEPTGVLGVDLGLINLATDSDGEQYSGAPVRPRRERRFQHRQRLQQANTRRARWRLRQRAGKEARLQRQVNHDISTRCVQKAKQQRKALALEDLTGIRARGTVRRGERRQRAHWAFHQLRLFVSYKAQRAGVCVVLIDPRTTSRTCSACGQCEKGHRKTHDRFLCVACGFAANADVNAAVHSSRAAVTQPLVSASTLGLDTSPGALALGC